MNEWQSRLYKYLAKFGTRQNRKRKKWRYPRPDIRLPLIYIFWLIRSSPLCPSFPAFLHFGHSLCFGLDLLFIFFPLSFGSSSYPLYSMSAVAAVAIRIPKKHTWLAIASTNTVRQPCYRQRSAYYTATAAITLLRRTHKTHSGTSHDHHHHVSTRLNFNMAAFLQFANSRKVVESLGGNVANATSCDKTLRANKSD